MLRFPRAEGDAKRVLFFLPGWAFVFFCFVSVAGCSRSSKYHQELTAVQDVWFQKAQANISSHPDSSLIYTDSLLKSIRLTSDSIRNIAQFLRARAFYELNQVDSALRILPRLRDECRTSNDTLTWLRTENLTGMVFMLLGQTERAIAHAQTAYQLAVQTGQRAQQVKALINLANFHSENNEWVKSQAYLYKASGIAKECDSLTIFGEITASISHNYVLMGMIDSAMNYGYRAIAIAEKSNVPSNRINPYNNMGMLHKRRDEDSALYWLRKALELNPSSLEVRFNIVNIYAGKRQFSIASGLLDTLLNDCKKTGSAPGITRCLWQRANILDGQGKPEAAIPYFKEAIRISDSLGIGYMANTARLSLADLLQRSGKNQQAKTLTDQVKRLSDSISRTEHIQALQMMQQHEEAERQRARLALAHTQVTLQRNNNRKIILLLLALVAILGLVILLYRNHGKRKKMELMRQLDRYRDEVLRWEQKAQVPQTEAGLLERLIRYMEQEKPWLNPEMKTADLLEPLNCSRSAFYAELNKSNIPGIAQLVQQYRVKEAIRLLDDPAYRHIKLEAIGAESGFGSYRSFHRSFEQFMGFTPAEYRRNREEEMNAIN
jgi:tetratricopeptide (TPR) repeat protein